METFAIKLTHLFLQRHYIEPDQAEWLQYGLVRRMMGLITFFLLLPIGATLVGWGGAFLYLYTFRFLRTRTGGYHAKTPYGCLLTSLGAMLASLMLAKNIREPIFGAVTLLVSGVFVFAFAPANNASLHLTANEITAIRPKARFRLICVISIGVLFLYVNSLLGICVAVSVLAVALMLLLTDLGFGAQ